MRPEIIIVFGLFIAGLWVAMYAVINYFKDNANNKRKEKEVNDLIELNQTEAVLIDLEKTVKLNTEKTKEIKEEITRLTIINKDYEDEISKDLLIFAEAKTYFENLTKQIQINNEKKNNLTEQESKDLLMLAEIEPILVDLEETKQFNEVKIENIKEEIEKLEETIKLNDAYIRAKEAYRNELLESICIIPPKYYLSYDLYKNYMEERMTCLSKMELDRMSDYSLSNVERFGLDILTRYGAISKFNRELNIYYLVFNANKLSEQEKEQLLSTGSAYAYAVSGLRLIKTETGLHASGDRLAV